jgi:transitional endoplasmic reticulum ATPase
MISSVVPASVLPALSVPTPLADIHLLPFQKKAVNDVIAMLPACPLIIVDSGPAMGRSTWLRHLAERLEAPFIDCRFATEIIFSQEQLRAQDVINRYLVDLVRDNPILVVDDYIQIEGVGGGRPGMGMVLWQNIQRTLLDTGHRLILNDFAGEGPLYGPNAAAFYAPDALGYADFTQLLADRLGDRFNAAAPDLDLPLIHRQARSLNLHQLVFLCARLRNEPLFSTERVLEILDAEFVKTNLKLEEVEALSFDSLPGTDAIAEALETHVVLPFQNKALAQELGLKPTRGVLLYGPPGTGKTSIGRALAHRMQGRFFLIDGSFITEPPVGFMAEVQGLVDAAKAAAPSVLFIDDADVLFQIEHIAGLSRFLLSLMDGLESDIASHVCVVMTAMDARKLPEALLRSGRVELWLETKAPDLAARVEILRRWTNFDVPGFEAIDFDRIAEATEDFTPADLRRLASEAKVLHAADRLRARPLLSANAYVDLAIAEMIDQRDVMARQLADEGLRIRAYA